MSREFLRIAVYCVKHRYDAGGERVWRNADATLSVAVIDAELL
jgi:hypothetical protein